MPEPGTAPSHWTLTAELLLLFVLLPLAFRFKPFPFPPIPALWLLACYCLYRLYHDAATGSLFASSFEHALYGC